MRDCLKQLMVVGALLTGALAAGCGEHNSLRIEDIYAERLTDHRVEVNVTLESGGMHDWSQNDEYCVVVTWFEPGPGAEPMDSEPVNSDSLPPCMNLPDFDPERDTEILTVEQCFNESIPLSGSVTHVIASTDPLPELQNIWITAKLRLGEEVEAAVPLVLHGPRTIFSP